MRSFFEYTDYQDKRNHKLALAYYAQSAMSVAEICSQLGLTKGTFYRILRKYGLDPHRKDRSQARKLIKAYASAGVKTNEIADMIGLSQRSVQEILRRERNLNIRESPGQ